MKEFSISTTIQICRYEELTDEERRVIEAAREATRNSYAPYSRFHVGAAALLQDGTIVCGTNQENAAYPSGLCAERTALFAANSQYPQQPVTMLAIAARNESGFTTLPVSPCGACRQVMQETENRYGHPMRLLLYGTNRIYRIDSAASLLPLAFGKDYLKENEEQLI